LLDSIRDAKLNANYSVPNRIKGITLKRSIKQRNEKFVRSEKAFHINPKTHNQKLLLEAINEFPITVTLGAAGVGKTYCAASKIAQLYLTGKYGVIL